MLARLDSLNSALSAAESSRIVREAIWRAVQSGDPEAISGLAGNPDAGPNTQNSLALLQSLRAQESSLKSQIAESANRYGENWPAFAEQRAHLESIQNSIQEEIRRLGDRAHTDYEVSLQAENAARDAFTQQKNLASQLTGNAVALRLARQEAGESRTLYTSLLGRLQQTGILEGLHSGNFAVVSPALDPPIRPPHQSQPAPAGRAGPRHWNCHSDAARPSRANSPITPFTPRPNSKRLLDTPVFATVPDYRLDDPWYRRLLPLPASSDRSPCRPAPNPDSRCQPQKPPSSKLCTGCVPPCCFRTATAAADHHHHRFQPRPCHRTSARPHDMPPSLALSLATVLAQHGSSVLFVDADLRSAPDVNTSTDPGLSEMLSSQAVLPFTHSIAGPAPALGRACRRSPALPRRTDRLLAHDQPARRVAR